MRQLRRLTPEEQKLFGRLVAAGGGLQLTGDDRRLARVFLMRKWALYVEPFDDCRVYMATPEGREAWNLQSK